jgi:uncharacterized protein (DUF342 family)
VSPGGRRPARREDSEVRKKPEFEFETDDYRVSGFTSGDRMRGLLVLERRRKEMSLSLGELLERIREGGITFGVDEAAVRGCLEQAAQKRRCPLTQIAAGREPEDGTDGQVEFYVQPSSEEARYTKDEHGRINYYELNLIENVRPGQELCRVLPPGPGADGSDVLGKAISARAGEPVKLRAGRGVAVSADGELYTAEIPGRLIHGDDTVEVSQEYEVRGDVDYSVGNIDFVGRVTVTGEILDEFNVKADMGLEVHGPVGNCQLSSEADVIMHGGMSGKTRGAIRAGGRVFARYLNECKLESRGDVVVEREAYNSVIRTEGAYISTDGKVVGGEVTALRGIEVGTAGSDLEVATRLRAGVDYRKAERRRTIGEEIERTEREIERVSTAIGPMLTDPRKVQALPTDKKKAVLGLVAHLKQLKQDREHLMLQRGGADGNVERVAVRQINVKERVHAGVGAEILNCRLVLRQASSGPLTMIEDRQNGSLRLVPFQKLGGKADLLGEPPEGDAPPEGA